ncbi:hypothetical protein AB5J62_26195 [Amycolatopsis sp. cg5]|uniref:hypothetical protein n=1 Tax=Amycolatopsis sp. cg5 TaxID=3238802 RepID=UPI003526318F
MSSGDVRTALLRVANLVDGDVTGGLDLTMEKWNQALVDFETAITGCVNLEGVDTAKRIFNAGCESLDEFTQRQDAVLKEILAIAGRL